MSTNPRARRPSGVPVALMLLALATVPAVSHASSGEPAYQVILKDGRVVPATTRPLIAMGKVSFLDGTSRTRSLSVSVVDLDATRASSGAVPNSSRVWTERSMKGVRGQIQIVGESTAEEGGAEPDAAPQSETADESLMTPAERIRAEIDRLNVKLRPLAPQDRQRTIIMMRQQELQQELDRILRPS